MNDSAQFVVKTFVNRQPALAKFSKAASGGERDSVLPLIDSGGATGGIQDAGNALAATKKRFGICDKHLSGAYSMLEPNIKDAVSISQYAGAHMETMGQRIKKMRDQRGWTQGQLAERVGVTVSAVSQWELDQTENVKLLPFLRLAKLFETDPHYLVFGQGRGSQELSRPVQATRKPPSR
jgi:DNA-binding XRE family transcriptional regulator